MIKKYPKKVKKLHFKNYLGKFVVKNVLLFRSINNILLIWQIDIY